MRRFVVFDIHGRNDQFLNVLKQWEFDYEKDLLISIGDLCDRGIDTFGVMETLLKCKNRILIRGNHDEPFADWLRTGIAPEYWNTSSWGGNATISSYNGKSLEDNQRHFELISEQVPYYLDEMGNLFCHAGFNKDILIEDNIDYNFWWDDDQATNMYVDYEFFDKRVKRVVAGHITTLKLRGTLIPIITDRYINGDTGCGKNGILTIMNIDTLEYKQFSF